MKLINKAVSKFRRDGLLSLSKTALGYGVNEILNHYRILKRKVFIKESIEIDGVTAKFSASERYGGDKVRQRIQTENIQLVDIMGEICEEDVIWDVGASIGTHTCFMMNSDPKCHVVAFEPFRENYEQLKENITHNGTNAEALQLALSNSTGEVEFAIPEADKVGTGKSSINPDTSAETITVQSYKPDELIRDQELPIPNIVKIDVEGAEPLVLKGMSDILSDDRCRLAYIEVHLPTDQDRPSIEDFGYTYEDVLELIERHGFKIELLNATEFDKHIKASKMNNE